MEHLAAKGSESQLVTKPELKSEYVTCIVDLVVINTSGRRHVNKKKTILNVSAVCLLTWWKLCSLVKNAAVKKFS